MSRINRILIVTLGLVAAAAAAIYVARGPLIAFFLRGALDRAGLEDPGFTVREASLSRLTLAELIVPKRDNGTHVELKSVSAEFDLGRLMRERVIDKITLGPGRVAIGLAPDGTISISKLKIGGGGQKGVRVDSVEIDSLAYRVVSPQGSVEGDVVGALHLEKGGALAFRASAADFSIGGFSVRDWREEGELKLSESGTASLSAMGAGALATSGVTLRGVRLGLEASADSWKDFVAGKRGDLEGEARLSLSSDPSPASGSPLLRSIFAIRQGPEEEAFALEGAATLKARGGMAALSFAEGGALRITSNGGDELRISSVRPDAPAFERSNGRDALALKAEVTGAALGGAARLQAERLVGAPWAFRLESAFANQTLWSWKLGATTLAAAGTADGNAIVADAKIRTTVREAHVGRLSILEAPVESDFRAEMDMKARAFAFHSAADDCLRMERGRFRLEGQNNETELKSARLCRSDGPLIVWRGGDAPHAEVKGLLTAKTGSYRLGATRLEGLPPRVDLEAEYRPRLKQTDVSGVISDGVVVVNRAVVATDAKGSFTGRLYPEGLSGEASISAVTLTQNVPAPHLAPISAAGSARLADEKVTFEYTAATDNGRAIGGGEGRHDVRRGVGTLSYRSGALVFTPRKLQPAEIVSALTGIVSGATGAAAAEATFAWGRKPSDFKSSGVLRLQDMSFIGPGRAVNRTTGVSGEIILESLTPLKSRGAQKILVSAVDMDALKLADGEIDYELPGDGTMRIASATFPWFGGRLGAYEATAALDGAAVDTALRAENVDLAQLLDYLRVEGLSGEGVIEGRLPLKIVNGKARIVNGVFSAKGPGVIRYVGKAGEAASGANKQAKLAFDILRDLHFDELTAAIDGPLDGELKFNIVFKGANQVKVDERTVTSPVVYRVSIEAPLLALIDQARLSSDIQLQIEKAGGSIDDGQ